MSMKLRLNESRGSKSQKEFPEALTHKISETKASFDIK